MTIINEKVQQYMDSFYRPISDQLEALRLVGEKENIPVILRDAEMTIRFLIEREKPKRILEIGTAIGYSAAVMATWIKILEGENPAKEDESPKKINGDIQIITIEKNVEMAQRAKENIKSLGLENYIKVIEGDANEILTKATKGEIPEIQGKFDMIFIDGPKSHYRNFWNLSTEFAKKGGLVICDNILMRGWVADPSMERRGRHKTSIARMQDFLKYITEEEKYNTTILQVGDGISITYTK